jgi:2-polyprenyl-6-methoxyphenol hydroxylase-like FAD-dependent oxidoreductase
LFDLRIVIIGGGIAGLAAAIALKRNKNEIVVKEKKFTNNNSGMAFMIHESTVRNINSLGDIELDVNNHEINNLILKDDLHTNHVKINGWYAIKRVKLLNFLQSQLTADEYHENCDFSHFQYEGDKAIAAVFKNGSIEYGDLFIGADGINSQVRNSVSEAHFFPNEINEIVCIAKYENENIHDNTFRKYLSIKKGMSFGFIPVSNNEHVWFLQFDRGLYGSLFEKSRKIETAFSPQLLSEFPKEIKNIIENSDLKKSHLWKSKELKLLNSYYKDNVCLIGDAAHGSIPLTSSGVSSGVSSAIELAEAINSSEYLYSALSTYEELRKKKNSRTIEYAQILKLQFNSPPDCLGNYHLPLFH